MSVLRRIYDLQQQSNNTNHFNFDNDVFSSSTYNNVAQDLSRNNTPTPKDCWVETTTPEPTSMNNATTAESTTKGSTGSLAKIFAIGLVLGTLVAGVGVATAMTLWKTSGSDSTTSSTSLGITTLTVTTTTSTTSITATTTTSSTSTTTSITTTTTTKTSTTTSLTTSTTSTTKTSTTTSLTTSTTSTTTSIPVCNPSCLNGGNCTATNVCTCSTAWTGSICQTTIRAFWAFDGTLQDSYNNFNGIGYNGITYQSSGYNGAGSCLWLNRAMSQSVVVNNPPFLNMSYTSLTLEVWIYAQTFSSSTVNPDNSIFGQWDQNTQDRLLHFVVRNQRVFLGFYLDDVLGNQILNTGQWYHLAYVYDYSVSTQYIYINSYLDASHSSAGPYQGTTGSLTIGTVGANISNNQFDGCLDSMAYYNRAKNATEVLNDATLVVYLPFDGNTLLDSGPLSINGTGANYSYTSSGQINQALSLSRSSSYVQVTGLRRLGTVAWPYSFAVWINPTSLAGGTIIHLSSRIDGAQPNAWCLAMMGLSSSGQIAINSWNNANVPLTGPQAPLNTWTHVVATYSPTNGERLYINGTLWLSTGAYNFPAGSVPMTITLGNSLLGTTGCSIGPIQMGQFYGSLDEFYTYARELTAAEVMALANP